LVAVKDGLLIPFALLPDGGRIAAREANRSDDTRCPGCGQALLLRAGEIRQVHFAHRSGFAGHGEGETHRLAKHHLAFLLEQARQQSTPRFPVAEPCWYCSRPTNRRLPTFASVAVEWSLSRERRVDVALLDADGQLVMVVEVLVSNRTDEARVAPAGVRWLEVAVENGLDPTGWTIANASRGLVCADCTPEYRERRQNAREDEAWRAKPSSTVPTVIDAGPVGPEPERRSAGGELIDAVWTAEPEPPVTIPLRPAGYRERLVKCGACGRTDQPFFDWEGTQPPEPRPATIRRFRWELPAAPLRQNPRSRLTTTLSGFAEHDLDMVLAFGGHLSE
jgi:hypothetical protein